MIAFFGRSESTLRSNSGSDIEEERDFSETDEQQEFWKGKYEELKRQNADLLEQKTQLKSDYSKLKARCKKKEKSLGLERQTIRRFQVTNGELVSRIEQITQENKLVKKQEEEARLASVGLKDKNQELERRLRQVQEENEENLERIEKVEKEVADYKKKVRGKIKEIKDLKSELEGRQDAYTKIEGLRNQLQKTCEEQKIKLEDQDSTLKQIVKEKRQLTTTLQKTQKNLEERRAKVEDLNQQVKNYESQIEVLDKKLAEQTEKFEKEKEINLQKIKQLEENLSSFKEELDIKEEKIKGLKQLGADAVKKSEEFSVAYEEIKQELQDLKNSYEEQLTEKRALQQEKRKLEKIYQEHKKKLEDQQELIDLQLKTLVELREEHANEIKCFEKLLTAEQIYEAEKARNAVKRHFSSTPINSSEKA